ncbi:MAG: pyridoxine 5'-phosphate synthase [Fibromonadaceae bacterium]|jgi:pyridoxine 5-phosphate synthase|nr:pyridoxine 5'-phosphate synthase [Fibromonadaceae bacterium]
MAKRLCVNIDHIATIREARKVREPEPVTAAMLAELAGCHGITVHLRQDRRHINDSDVHLLRHTVSSSLNLEMAPTAEMVAFAKQVLPNMVTLVPEGPNELTTEGGLNVEARFNEIADAVQNLRNSGIFASLFIDPKAEQVKAARKTSADYVEFHTGPYANAFELRRENEIEQQLSTLQDCITLAIKSGLKVNAGHGLNYRNISRISELSGVEELNIGHSIIARAALVGMERAVREMLALIGK